MSEEKSLDELMAELRAGEVVKSTETAKEEPVTETVEAPKVEAPKVETPKVETPKEEKAVESEAPAEVKAETDPLEGLLVGEAEVPEPEPVKKRRGRPAKSAATKKEAAVVAAPETKTAEVQTPPVTIKDTAPTVEATEEAIKAEIAPEAPAVPKDIYILAEAQIFNGHVYRRGQKITFTVGDKFYNSQFDRAGKNWLDIVDDLEAQYAYFGRVIVEPDRWSGIPLGSTEGVQHPGIALALAKIAQEEYERNGTPFTN